MIYHNSYIYDYVLDDICEYVRVKRSYAVVPFDIVRTSESHSCESEMQWKGWLV